MPVQRETAVGMPQESSSSICKMSAFYEKYKIEFHISGMVFCLIGGKVHRFCPSLLSVLFKFDPIDRYHRPS